jgi:hypothetical protein
MFTGQFKHDDLNNQISQIDKKIFAQKNQIAKLELKFSYLTSPGRIKKLSAKYLGDQEIITPRQVKDPQKLERYYLAKLKSLYGTNLAAIQDQEINLN